MSHKRKSAGPPPFSSTDVDGGDLRPRRAFHVSGRPDFSQGEPQSAAEYLRRVKWEARQQPKVFTAANPQQWEGRQTAAPTQRVRGLALLPPTSPLVLPSKEWEQRFALHFADVRHAFLQYLHTREEGGQRVNSQSPPHPRPQRPLQLPPTRDYPAWLRFCLGGDLAVERCIRVGGRGTEGAEGRGAPVNAPDLRTVAAWDQLSTRAILHRLVDHLLSCHQRVVDHRSATNTTATAEDGDDSDDEEGDGDVGEDEEDETADGAPPLNGLEDPSAASADSIGGARSDSGGGAAVNEAGSASALGAVSVLCLPRPSHTVWLHATLAHLEKPLPADVEVQLRQLYRVCGKIRAEAGQALEALRLREGDGEEVEGEERAVLECVMHCNLLMTIVDKVFGQRVDLEEWKGG